MSNPYEAAADISASELLAYLDRVLDFVINDDRWLSEIDNVTKGRQLSASADPALPEALPDKEPT